MGTLQRQDFHTAVAIVIPSSGFVNQTGFRSFTRLAAGQYELECDTAIAAAEAQVKAYVTPDSLTTARGRLSNANDGLVTVEVRSSLGELVDPPVLFVEVSQIATGPGTPLPSGGGGGGSGNVALYVDTVDGDDANPGTLLLPLLTLNAAMARVPNPVPVDYEIISLNAAAPMVATGVTFQPRTYLEKTDGSGVACVYLRGNVYTQTLAPFVAAGGTGAAVVVSAGLVADAHYRQWLQPMTGASLGQFRQVRNNTTTNLVPVEEFSPAPAPGDSVRAVRPACTIDMADCDAIFGGVEGAPLLTSPYAGGVVIESMRFVNGTLPVSMYGRITFYLCDDDGTVTFLPANASAFPLGGIDNLLLLTAQAPANVRGVSAQAFLGAGYSSYATIGLGFAFSGYSCSTRCGVYAGLAAYIKGGRVAGTATPGDVSLTAFDNSVLNVDGGAVDVLIAAPVGTRSAVQCATGAQMRLAHAQIDCGGAAGNAIHATLKGTIRCEDSLSGNALGYGGFADAGGFIATQAATCGPVGATANLAVGITPDVAASIAVVGEALLSTAQNDGSCILRTA